MSDIEKIRLLISDTEGHFTDEQLSVFLEMAGSVKLAAAYALEAWAASLTDSYVREDIGDYSYTKREANSKLELAKRYREDEAAEPYSAWTVFGGV
ncbi:MAG: DUF3199 family protein [Methanofastidiosum sp.]